MAIAKGEYCVVLLVESKNMKLSERQSVEKWLPEATGCKTGEKLVKEKKI